MYFIGLCPEGLTNFINSVYVREFLCCIKTLHGEDSSFDKALNTQLYTQIVGVSTVGSYIDTPSGSYGLFNCLDKDDSVNLEAFTNALEDASESFVEDMEIIIIIPSLKSMEGESLINILDKFSNTFNMNLSISLKTLELFESECGLDITIN